MIKWSATKEDMELIDKITKRAAILYGLADARSMMNLNMDITATHLNGCPLKLKELLASDDYNFGHDIVGISNHLNRETGEIEDCFLPRCAQPELKKAAA
jgi:hypothetical protein